MKIKIVSDLHTENIIDFKFIEEGDFDALFIAGDISTRIEVEQRFLEQFKKPVFAVAGNHLGYNFDKQYLFHKIFYDNIDFLKNDTHTELIKRSIILNTLSNLPNIQYLQNTYTALGNYIVYGGTMYTNFELYGKKNIKACMKEAEYYINDFRKLYKYNKGFSLINPKDYRKYFNKFMKGLKQCLQETNKDIIILTHFCPSLKSINTQYYNELDLENSCFASNLDNFIQDNPRIKLWIHGHIHSACDYTIGQCRVVCNPFGYLGENYYKHKDYKEVIVEV